MNKLLIFGVITMAYVSCKSPEARKPISVKTGSFIDASVERNKKLNEKEKALFEALMTSNPNNEYIASQSGFWYYYNTKSEIDSLITPDFGDIITFNYNVKTPDGNLVYSKENLNTQNYAMDKQELFTGLREGLKLMKTGETVTFLFPSQKAYGYYGDNNKIGTNTPLICEVTIQSIIEN